MMDAEDAINFFMNQPAKECTECGGIIYQIIPGICIKCSDKTELISEEERILKEKQEEISFQDFLKEINWEADCLLQEFLRAGKKIREWEDSEGSIQNFPEGFVHIEDKEKDEKG